MRVLGESSEEEMVASFLGGELLSERFGAGIRDQTEGDERARRIADATRRYGPACERGTRGDPGRNPRLGPESRAL